MSWLSPTENFMTKWVTKSWVLNKMYMIDPPTVWVSPLIISVVYVSWFELRFSHECWWLKQWHLAALFRARKRKSCYACAGIKLSLSVIETGLTQALARRVRDVMTHFLWVSAMTIKLPRICSLFSVVIITRFSWHFAALPVTMSDRPEERRRRHKD